MSPPAIVTGNVHPLPRRAPSLRHSWNDPVRFPYKTERQCSRCGIVKVTRHEPGEIPWIEFHRGLDRIAGLGAPKCEVRA